MAQIIGIGGPSRSGKTTLSRQIKNHLSDIHVLLLDMDDYVYPETNIPKIHDRTDWEIPESTDFDRIIYDIKSNKEQYDFIIVEGILAFTSKALFSLYDATIWIQLSKESFLDRRANDTRWGKEPEWYLTHVWDSYLKHGQYPKADVILSGERYLDEAELNKLTRKMIPNTVVL